MTDKTVTLPRPIGCSIPRLDAMIPRLFSWFCFALLVAVLANGATAYLKRVGLLDRAAYTEYITIYCQPASTPCSCMRDPEGTNASDNGENSIASASLPSRRYVYDVHGFERALKPIKDGLFLAFFAISAGLMATQRVGWPGWRQLAPLAPLGLSIAIGFTIAVTNWGLTLAALGLRTFALLGVAILGAWASRNLVSVSRALLVLLVVQVLLVVAEFYVGIPLRYCDLGFRAAGTLVIANSLGVFAVVALAFCCVFPLPRWAMIVAGLSTVSLLFASAAGTGIVCFVALGGYLLLRRLSGKWRIAAALACIASAPLFIWKLPEIANRPGLYDSVLAKEGRVDNLLTLVSQADFRQLVIGQGLGFGSNASMTAVKGAPTALPNNSLGEKFAADSTITTLFIQLGLAGVAFFYAVLAWAFFRDRKAQPFYLVVGIASVTMIVTELFPVNLLLGLMLAHTFWGLDEQHGKPAFVDSSE